MEPKLPPQIIDAFNDRMFESSIGPYVPNNDDRPNNIKLKQERIDTGKLAKNLPQTKDEKEKRIVAHIKRVKKQSPACLTCKGHNRVCSNCSDSDREILNSLVRKKK